MARRGSKSVKRAATEAYPGDIRQKIGTLPLVRVEDGKAGPILIWVFDHENIFVRTAYAARISEPNGIDPLIEGVHQCPGNVEIALAPCHPQNALVLRPSEQWIHLWKTTWFTVSGLRRLHRKAIG
jgi:hypothetical protein